MAFKKIRFLTDSTCDLPAELVAKHEIGIVPSFVNYGGQSYADGIDITRDEFYRQLPLMSEFPTTSAMPPAIVEEAMAKALTDADHLFAITVASKLSGIYNTMRLAALKFPPERVTVIDSESVSLRLGFQVLIGAEVAAETGDVEQVQSAIRRVRAHTELYAALETMEFLRRSGRVGWAAASIGALLQIKPLFCVRDGEVKPISRIRTFGRAVDELIRLAHLSAPLDRMAIIYIADRSGAEDLRDRLADIAPPDTFIASVTPTIGSHVGTGGLGVVTVSSAWRN